VQLSIAVFCTCDWSQFRPRLVVGVQFNSIIPPWRRIMSCPTRGRVSFLNFNPDGEVDGVAMGSTRLMITLAFLPDRAIALSHFFLLWFLPRFFVLSTSLLAAAEIDKITPRQNAAFTRSLAGDLYWKLTWNIFRGNCESSNVRHYVKNRRTHVLPFFWNYNKLHGKNDFVEVSKI